MSEFLQSFGPFLMVAVYWVTIRLLGRKIDALTVLVKEMHTYALNSRRRGIYRIVCLENNAEYYGSTKSNFLARWGQHVRDLNKQQHANPRLQEDWNRYGPDAFGFYIEQVLDDDALIVETETRILKYRAMHVAPILNYNVNNSRVYHTPAAPDVETVFVRQVSPAKRKPLVTPPPDDRHVFSLKDLNLTDEEIAALEGLS